jgi:hypothetical protein
MGFHVYYIYIYKYGDFPPGKLTVWYGKSSVEEEHQRTKWSIFNSYVNYQRVVFTMDTKYCFFWQMGIEMESTYHPISGVSPFIRPMDNPIGDLWFPGLRKSVAGSTKRAPIYGL